MVDEAEEITARPTAIIDLVGTGRGPNTKYRILWSDGIQTFNKAADVKASIPEMLQKWQRARYTANNRKSREAKRERERMGG